MTIALLIFSWLGNFLTGHEVSGIALRDNACVPMRTGVVGSEAPGVLTAVLGIGQDVQGSTGNGNDPRH